MEAELDQVDGRPVIGPERRLECLIAKRCGRGGTKNKRGDFTWKELEKKALDFLGQGDDE